MKEGPLAWQTLPAAGEACIVRGRTDAPERTSHPPVPPNQLASLRMDPTALLPAPTAAAVLERLAAQDAPVLSLLALCRTPPFQTRLGGRAGAVPPLRPPPSQAGPSQPRPRSRRPRRGRAASRRPRPPLLPRPRPGPLRQPHPRRAVRPGPAPAARPAARPPQRRPQPGRTHPQGRRRAHRRPGRPHRPVPRSLRLLPAGLRTQRRSLSRHQRRHPRPARRRTGSRPAPSPPASGTPYTRPSTGPMRTPTTTGCRPPSAKRACCWATTAPPATTTPAQCAWPARPTPTATWPRCAASSACLAAGCPSATTCCACSSIGPVVVFAGHAIDRPGAPFRFPADAALEAAVRDAIRKELDALDGAIGYCSPACGSDLLFAELMRDRGGELHLVLPFAEEEFCTERLTYGGLPALEPWRRRYAELRGDPHVVRHFATTEEFLNDQVLYDFAGGFMQGLALTRAAQVGGRGRRPGRCATRCSRPARAAWPRSSTTGGELAASRASSTSRRSAPACRLTAPPCHERPAAPSPPPASHRPGRTVRAMLFADVAGFSGLPEPHLPAFFIEFLALVEQQLKTTPTLFRNTWGDGLYIVFPDVVGCADFALRLLRRLEGFDFAGVRASTAGGQEAGRAHRPAHRAGLRGLTTRSSAATTTSAATSAGRPASSR